MPTKQCSKCKIPKFLSEFYRRAPGYKKSKDGYRAQCKACERSTALIYRNNHLDASRANTRRHHETHREEGRLYTRNYYKIHKEKILEERRDTYQSDLESNREKSKARAKKERQTKPEQVHARDRKHKVLKRARKLNAPEIEYFTHEEIAMRDNWKCHLCGKRVTRKNWSIDHLQPMSKDGSETRQNVALAHVLCNVRRGAGRKPAQLRLF